LIGRSD